MTTRSVLSPCLSAVTAVFTFFLVFFLVGCKHDGPVFTGDAGPPEGGATDAAVVVPSDGGCVAAGNTCASGGECCSGACTNNLCAAAKCSSAGAACTHGTDCCNLNCSGGTCGAAACISDNQPCGSAGSCCSTQCVNGSCKPLNSGCKTAGNSCPNGNGDCCSSLCEKGVCAAPSQVSYCTQPGDICFHSNECCTGVCAGATTTAAGTCATISTGCAVDGLVCNGCTGCCSSFCAPYGTTSSKICQPASGCHVTGDLCHTDSDCCGGDPSRLVPSQAPVSFAASPTRCIRRSAPARLRIPPTVPPVRAVATHVSRKATSAISRAMAVVPRTPSGMTAVELRATKGCVSWIRSASHAATGSALA